MVQHELDTFHWTIHWSCQWPDNILSVKKFRYDDKREIAREFQIYEKEWTELDISWYIDETK